MPDRRNASRRSRAPHAYELRAAQLRAAQLRGSMTLERLEGRQLMTNVTIGTPTGGDDWGMITSAMSAAHSGDTVSFSSGTYHLSRAIQLEGGVTYAGSGTTLKSDLGSGEYGAKLDTGNSSNITVKGITFNGGGIRVESATGMVNGLTITQCGFTTDNGNINHRNENEMIYITSGTQNTVISSNSFYNIGGGGYGILMYNVESTRVVSNNFNHVMGDGIAYYAYAHDRGHNVVLSANTFTDMPDKAIETGGPGANGVDVSFNQISGYIPGTLSDDTMALSLVFWSNQPQYPVGTVLIHDNTITGPNNDVENGASRPGVRIAIETAGDHTEVYNNHVCGTNVGVAIGYSMQPEYIHDNYFVGTNYPSGIVYEGYSPLARLSNNLTSGIACTIVNNPTPAGPPVPGSGGSSTPTPTSTPSPAGTPPILTGAASSTSTINLAWTDTNTSTTSYLIERRLPSDTGFVQISNTNSNPKARTFTDTSLPAGSYIYYRIRAVTSAGISPYSNLVAVKTRGVKLAAYSPVGSSLVTKAYDPANTVAGLLSLVDTGSPFAD